MKTLYIKDKEQLTDENIKKWIDEGITTIIVYSDNTVIHNIRELNKVFEIKPNDYVKYVTLTTDDILRPNKKQQKQHYRSIQNKHTFKNNYKKH